MFINLYNILIRLLYPLAIRPYINKRKEQGKEDVKRFNERIGKPNLPRPEGQLFWMHGASVGESLSMLPLIDKLLRTYPQAYVMVTTGTTTSAELMGKRLPERAFHQYIPIDNPKFTRRFVKYWHPEAVLWFESDLWPAMLSAVKRKNIPLILMNGRISNRSFKRWQQFDFICKELLSCFSYCLGQSDEDAHRLKVLGAKKAECLGNLKYAGLPLPVDEEKKKQLLSEIGGRTIWLASSTHDDEEMKIARFHGEIKKEFPDLLLIIAPRHPNRGEEIQRQIREQLQLNVALRSANEPIGSKTDIYIANTIGEMGLWYSICPLVFIGGSLIPHGGQNFMEPSRCHDAVIVGPYMHNFTDAMNRALKADAVTQVNNVMELSNQVGLMLENNQLLKEKQQKAYDWAMSESEILDKIMEKIKEYIQR